MPKIGPTNREQRRRGPAHDAREIRRAKELRRYGASLRAIGAELDVPETTVQYWVRDTVPDKSGRWTLRGAAEVTIPDASLVLAELGAVIFSSDGRVTGMTNDEARWVTLLGRVRPDLMEHGPGSTWQTARDFLEAIDTGDESALQRLEQGLAEGSARLRWPENEAKVAELRAKARRWTEARAAGLNPSLDGRPYRPEDKP